MQFIITAYDGNDEKALERRLAVREQHLYKMEKMFNEKKQLYGTAILDDYDKMIGSLLVVDFPSRDELDEYLKTEPYVIGNVWERIEIKPCKVSTLFLNLYK